MTTDKRSEIIGPDHPIAVVANAISAHAFEIAARSRISRWDLCVGLANACGQIMADSDPANPPPSGVVMPSRVSPMPRKDALERMDSLREIMQGAYDLRNVEGSG